MTILTDPDRISALSGPPSASRFDAPLLRVQQPDRHLALDVSDTSAAGGPTCRARCSLWWTDTPSPPDAPDAALGCIGHYAAEDDAAAATLLDAALDRLADAGCERVVGPMDGATWFPYRFVTDRGSRPPFLMEPWHPPAYPDQFVAAGFSPAATYVSAHVPSLPDDDPGPPPLNVTTRPIDLDRAEAELRRAYDLVVRAFADNPYYTPISETAFLTLYRGLLPVVDPALARFAETPNGDLAGLLFCLPDRSPGANDDAVDTLIVKTLAVDPALAGQGLGSWLTAHGQARARANGYTQAIHALMHDSNRSRKISRHHGDVFRRYTLFERSLPRTKSDGDR